MNRKILSVVLGICLGTLACNALTAANPSSGNSTQQASAANSSSPSAIQSSSSGACSNPLYPVKQGLTRTYSTTGLPTGPSTYTETITDVSADGFTMTTQFAKLTRTAKWDCKPDGLIELQLGGGAASLNTSSGMQANFTVTNSSGVTLPVKISAGDTWTYSLDFTAQITTNQYSGQAQGTADYQAKALGSEKVTVAAGTFDAMKLQVGTTLKMQMAMQGMSIPITITDNATLWFAPNVGMVKQVDTANMMGSNINATTELQSYNIP
jgi:hypothetical protein